MLIGLHGKKQAGKDTVYRRIAHVMAGVLEVERVSFADRLYASAAAALGVTAGELSAWKVDDDVRITVQRRIDTRPTLGADGYISDETLAGLNVREYLQRYGTEAHRDVFGPDFWVERVPLDHDRRIVCVTDVRFANEAEAVRAAGGVVVRVIGPDEVEAAGDGHASEEPLAPGLIDYTLPNRKRNDDFAQLDEYLALLLRDLLKEAA